MHMLFGSGRFLAVVNGQEAWEEVCREIRHTLDDPLRGLPVLTLFVLVVLVVWANVRIARWLFKPRIPHHVQAHRDHHQAGRGGPL
ncbi:MAG: hypothetical protein K8E66_01405 [Phycisphaerales bacterium]|nr:hypothetical protein [Phycisphaerales bacterium]